MRTRHNKANSMSSTQGIVSMQCWKMFVYNMPGRVRRYTAQLAKGGFKCSPDVLKMSKTSDGRTLDCNHICAIGRYSSRSCPVLFKMSGAAVRPHYKCN